MSRFLTLVLLVSPLLVVAAPSPAEREPLQVGKNLPGSFQAFNVTGLHAGKYHCQVTEHNYEPGILVFVRDFEAPDALAAVRPLLAVIDDRIEKNFTRIRLNCTAVFFTNVMTDVTGTAGTPEVNAKNDDLREQYDKELKDFANAEPKFKQVLLALDDKDDLKKYALDDSKFVTVVLYKRLQVVAVYALAKNELNEKAIGQINTDITEKLGATRK